MVGFLSHILFMVLFVFMILDLGFLESGLCFCFLGWEVTSVASSVCCSDVLLHWSVGHAVMNVAHLYGE